MDQTTVQVAVLERNEEIGQTSQGTPKLGIKTASGKWVQVTGMGVEKIKAGQALVISEPKQFGKQWFASLKEIKAGSPAPSANGNGATAPRFDAKPEKMSWDDFERTIRAAHAIILEFEPDTYATNKFETETKEGEAHTEPYVIVDRSLARATMLDTIIIALTKDGGRIEPSEKVPF